MDQGWLITAILGAVVIYFIYWLMTMNHGYWEKKGIKVLNNTPVFGVLWDMLLGRKGFGEVLTDLYVQLGNEKYGGYFQLGTPTLMVKDPELLNQILIKDFTHFEDRAPPMNKRSDLFAMNLSNLTGDEWRKARHKLTPTFTSGKLKMMFDSISECGEQSVDFVNSNLNTDMNAKDFAFKYLLNVVANVAFGLQLNSYKEEGASSEFFRISSQFFKPSTTLLLKFFFSFSAPRISRLLNFKFIDGDVNDFFRKLTSDIIRHRESTGTRRNDFLQIMLDLKKETESQNNEKSSFPEGTEDPDDKELLENLKHTPTEKDKNSLGNNIFTEDFIAAQTFLFISGGSETTATVLHFILYDLATNPDVQKRAQQEIDDVLSSHEFDYQSVKKLTYLEQVIYESIRMHPLAAALMRVCTQDYTIPGTNKIIDKGTFVSIPIGGFHKDAQYFPEPDKFDPDRFSNMDTIPRGVYFSFGSGPRICIAMRLAMLEMKVIVAKLLLNFTIILSKKTQLPLKMVKNAFIANVEGGIWIQIEKRK